MKPCYSLVGEGCSESHVEALLRGDERKSSTSMAPRLSRPVLPYSRNVMKGLCSLVVVNDYDWKTKLMVRLYWEGGEKGRLSVRKDALAEDTWRLRAYRGSWRSECS